MKHSAPQPPSGLPTFPCESQVGVRNHKPSGQGNLGLPLVKVQRKIMSRNGWRRDISILRERAQRNKQAHYGPHDKRYILADTQIVQTQEQQQHRAQSGSLYTVHDVA
jgi:hypothetical protein